MYQYNPNQYIIGKQKGNLTSDPNFNVLSVKIDDSEVNNVTFAQPVVIVGTTEGKTSVKLASTESDDILGFVLYSIRKDTFKAGDYISIAIKNSIMLMEAGEAISAGAHIKVDPATNKILNYTDGATDIGVALEKADGDGSLIPVLILTPNSK